MFNWILDRLFLERRICAWGVKTFGPPDTEYHLVERAAQEMKELIDDYDNLSDDEVAEECADIHHMLIQICGNAGRSLNAETRRKFGINRGREWLLHGDGTGQHV